MSLKWLFVIVIFLAGCKEATELSDGPIDIYHLVPPGKVGIWVNFELDSDTIRNGSILYGKLYLEGDSAFKRAALENHFDYIKTYYYYSSHYPESLKIGSGVDTVDFEMRIYEPNLSEGDYKERRESIGIMASFINKTDRYDTTFILTSTFTIKGR